MSSPTQNGTYSVYQKPSAVGIQNFKYELISEEV